MRILCRAQRIGNDSREKSGSGENIMRLQGISTSVLKRLISEHLNIASHTTLNAGVNRNRTNKKQITKKIISEKN